MAGFIQVESDWFYRTDDATYGLNRGTVTGAWTVLEAKQFPLLGTWTPYREFDPGVSYNAYQQVTFLEDFYNRIHFSPATIDFGAISQTVYREVSIWSAYLGGISLDTITTLAEASVAHLPPPSTPYTFLPLQTKAVRFTAAEYGVSRFFGYTTFGFSVGNYAIPTYGERSVLTELGPNWLPGMVETLSFLTEIVNVSRNGKEQRRALRYEPRRTLEYSLALWGANRNKVEAQLYKWRRRTTVVVLDPYRAKVVTGIAPGTLTVVVEGGVPRWAAAGVMVRVSHPLLPAGITSTIASKTNNTLTFTTGASVGWPSGTRLTWAMTARLEDKTKLSHLTDDATTVRMKYNSVPGVDPAYTPSVNLNFFNGREIFLKKPNWKDSVAEEFQHYLSIVDFQRGKMEFYEHIDFAQAIRTVGFSGIREVDILEVSDFFRRQLGRLREFYYPTWQSDISVKFRILAGNSHLRVDGTDLALSYANQTTHKAVLIQLNNGTYIPMTINSIYTVNDDRGEDTIVSFTTPFTQGIELANVKLVSWLMRCRLASDNLEIKWLSDNKATTQLSFLSLEHLA